MKKIPIKTRHTLGLFTILLLLLFGYIFFVEKEIIYLHKELKGIDPIGYFVQLRSIYFDHDYDFTNDLSSVFYSANWTRTFYETAAGTSSVHWTFGTALLWLPFYASGHLWAAFLNHFSGIYPMIGLEFPFAYAARFGTMVWGFIGVCLVYRISCFFFSTQTSFYACILGWLGSPFLYYQFVMPIMAHANSMFMLSLFYFYLLNSKGRADTFRWTLLGILGAIMVMVRLQNVAFLLPAFIELFYIKEGPSSERRLGPALKCAAIFGFSLLVAFLPQLIIWKINNGSFLAVTYLDEAGGATGLFNIQALDLTGFFFSTRYGMVPHTPILLFGFLGFSIFCLKNKLHRPLLIATLISLLGEIFVLSMYTWDVGDSFGSRHTTQSTGLFILGLAYVIESLRKNGYSLALPYFVFSVLVLWNILFIFQDAWSLTPNSRPLTLDELFAVKWSVLMRLVPGFYY